MATQHPGQDRSAQSTQQDAGRQENQNNQNASAPNPADESISTAGDYALGKGSKTDVRKEEKEANDNYDHGRQA